MSSSVVTMGLLGLLAWTWATPTWSVDLSDPTQPPTEAAPAPPPPEPIFEPEPEALTLNSILIAPQRRVAIINQRMLGVGGRILEAQVTEIRADAVVLRRGEQELTLTLDLPTVKRSPGATP